MPTIVAEKKEDKFKVAEIFGPTIQGEGPDAGRPCYFLRLGGCDYKCSWCDSMHAVDPVKVRQLPYMNSEQIVTNLNMLGGMHPLLIISGGNPAMWDLHPLLDELEADPSREWEVAVETQGTFYNSWLSRVDRIIVSPKPPSSKMKTNFDMLGTFLHETRNVDTHLKIVTFDVADLEWAMSVQERFNIQELYISIGTLPTDTRDDLLNRYRVAIQEAIQHYALSDALSFRISPQMHVLVWGHIQGV